MSFGHPLLLLTLVVPAVAALLYAGLVRRPSRYPVSFTNLDVLAEVARRRLSWRGVLPPALFLLALLALCVAVARPHVERSVLDERATVILVLDASRSMQSVDVRPSRLVAAERAANTFLDRIPDQLRVALIVFSGDVQVAAPPTDDHELVRRSIADIGNFSGYGGTAIGDALARAVELGQDAVRDQARVLASALAPSRGRGARGLVTIVFLSDGRQNRGLLAPLDGAARAKAAGIPVFTIALGTRGGMLPAGGGFGGGGGGGGFGGRGAPDPRTLRAIARVTGGKFYEARSAGSVDAAYAALGSRLGRKPGSTEVTFAFLIAAAVALVASALLSAAWSPRLP